MIIEIDCENCQPGTYYNKIDATNYICEKCLPGSYSDFNTLLKDKEKCLKCPNNFYSSNILNLTSFNYNFNKLFSTNCKSEMSQNCEFIIGFQPKIYKIISVLIYNLGNLSTY